MIWRIIRVLSYYRKLWSNSPTFARTARSGRYAHLGDLPVSVFKSSQESNVVDRFESRIPDKHTYDMIFSLVEEDA